MLDTIFDIIADAFIDTLKLIPFLFITYLLMEIIEHKAADKSQQIISKAGSLGPVLGAALGAVPQCGFSTAASSLFSGGIVSVGTLIAIFLATSDEMVPVCISAQVKPTSIVKILIYKVTIGIIFGFMVDIIIKFKKNDIDKGDIHCLCDEDHCHCEKSIWKSALHHTLKIGVFILIINLVLNCAITFIGENNLSKLFLNIPILSCLISAIVGLIPNCAASVVITTLYIEGIISSGSLMAGLLAGSGLGILVLFKTNKNLKQNINILISVYLISVICGIIFDLLKIVL